MLGIFFDVTDDFYRMIVGPPLSLKETFILALKLFCNCIIISFIFALPTALYLYLEQLFINGF